VFLTLSSYFIFLKLLQRPTVRYWLCYIAVTVLLFYAHYYAFLVIAAQFSFLCFMRGSAFPSESLSIRRVDGVFLGQFLAAAAVCAAAFIPWVVYVFKPLASYTFTPEHFDCKLVLRLFREFSGRSYPLSFFLLLLAPFGAVKLWSEQKYAPLVFLLLWL